jgi:Fe2+ transport system protein FeoA
MMTRRRGRRKGRRRPHPGSPVGPPAPAPTVPSPFQRRCGGLPWLRIVINLKHNDPVNAYSMARSEDVDATPLRLADIPLGQEVELEAMELPEAEVEALLERGVLPGCRLCPVRRSPFGDPIVKVEGTVLALRREMASCLCVRLAGGN